MDDVTIDSSRMDAARSSGSHLQTIDVHLKGSSGGCLASKSPELSEFACGGSTADVGGYSVVAAGC